MEPLCTKDHALHCPSSLGSGWSPATFLVYKVEGLFLGRCCRSKEPCGGRGSRSRGWTKLLLLLPPVWGQLALQDGREEGGSQNTVWVFSLNKCPFQGSPEGTSGEGYWGAGS